jgi:hypothetical protein
LRHCCDFGSRADTVQLLAVFHTNGTVTDFTIQQISELPGSALGNSLSGLIQNMPQLQRLDLYGNNHLGVEGVRALQPALRVNRTLKRLTLGWCLLGDDGFRLVADALVGNTTLDLLNVRSDNITSAGLGDITRMIELTQLQTIDLFWNNEGIFNNQDATQYFVSALQQKKSNVQELPGIEYCNFSGDNAINIATVTNIQSSLTRNQQLNRVALLLVPPPPPPPLQRQRQRQQQQQQHATSRMMLRMAHKAIAKFATVGSDNNAGTTAIFKLFQLRPALLEKRIKRAAAAAAAATAAAAAAAGSPTNSNRRSIENGGGARTDINSLVAAKKRRRLQRVSFFKNAFLSIAFRTTIVYAKQQG